MASYRKKVGRNAPIPTGANAGKASQRWFESLKAEALNEIIQENADRAMGIVRPRKRTSTLRQWLGGVFRGIAGDRG
ncbi:MAG: hypothetical protein KME20_28665 [Kaiparowitsia implicata GSE-PSE-MK54-09C]|nr:hypothetical protein [Kaiparowitsia implicata GSE-PSE-MK54-09C]